MDVLTLNGKQYVKASRAAKDLGYASDYVGQLCRSGAVDAHLVGRTWYVNPDTLGAHRIEKKRNARTKAREYAKKSIEEARKLNIHENTKGYKNIAIHYEKDKGTLIPEIKKLPILSTVVRLQKASTVNGTPAYTVENENKKIVMSGVIQVRDAELEETYTDTVILEPKIQKSIKKPLAVRPKVEDVEEEQGDTETEEVEIKKPVTFIDRLEALESVPKAEGAGRSTELSTKVSEVITAEDMEEGIPVDSNASGLRFPYLLVQIICGAVVILSLLALFIEISYVYTEESYNTSYSLTSHIFNKI